MANSTRTPVGGKHFSRADHAGVGHLGWHYAIDGDVSIMGTALIWKLSGLMTRAWQRRFPDERPDMLPSQFGRQQKRVTLLKGVHLSQTSAAILPHTPSRRNEKNSPDSRYVQRPPP